MNTAKLLQNSGSSQAVAASAKELQFSKAAKVYVN